MSYLDYFCELLKRKFLATGEILDIDIKGFQTKEIDKNLYHSMSDKTKSEYKNSDGDELKKGRIDMIRSSAAMIYNLFMRHVTKLYVTEINKEFVGDSLFPKIDTNTWNEVSRSDLKSENGIDFQFVEYVRK